MRSQEILEGQTIVLKRGRLNNLGFEPAFNSYFDLYASTKYISPALLQLEDIGFHLYLRKNLNDQNPQWKMPTIRQMRAKFGIGHHKLDAMMRRLEGAHLLRKISGVRKGEENVRNGYILSDPVQTLEEFLTIAREGVFSKSLKAEWISCPHFEDMVSSFQGHDRVLILRTDQQTLKTEQGVWDSVLTQLQFAVPQGTFAVFLRDTELLSIVEGVATVGTRRPHACEWLQVQMAPRIKKVLAAELSARRDSRVVEEVRCVVVT